MACGRRKARGPPLTSTAPESGRSRRVSETCFPPEAVVSHLPFYGFGGHHYRFGGNRPCARAREGGDGGSHAAPRRARTGGPSSAREDRQGQHLPEKGSAPGRFWKRPQWNRRLEAARPHRGEGRRPRRLPRTGAAQGQGRRAHSEEVGEASGPRPQPLGTLQDVVTSVSPTGEGGTEMHGNGRGRGRPAGATSSRRRRGVGAAVPRGLLCGQPQRLLPPEPPEPPRARAADADACGSL